MFNEEITKIGNALGLEGKFLTNFGFEQIMAILNPPSEMEPVEIEQWAIVKGDGTIASFQNCDTKQSALAEGCLSVKLTGTYHRPKPQPVERSVSAEVEWRLAERPDGAPVSYPSCRIQSEGDTIFGLEGKTGTLTFTLVE